MYYQNLIFIHECSKKLLKMKSSKSFFNTYYETFTSARDRHEISSADGYISIKF